MKMQKDIAECVDRIERLLAAYERQENGDGMTDTRLCKIEGKIIGAQECLKIISSLK